MKNKERNKEQDITYSSDRFDVSRSARTGMENLKSTNTAQSNNNTEQGYRKNRQLAKNKLISE